MTDFVATEPVWIVLTELGQIAAVEVGQQFTSRQVCEVYVDEAAAVVRAVECGWTPDDDLLPEVD